MSRHLRLAFLAVAATLAAAAPAAADSIVYVRDGNVWLAAPDGSRQTQVTTSGGYGRAAQSDDGTIIATKDKLLQRLDRGGHVLNTAGSSDYTGPVAVSLAPDGQLAVYGYFATGPILDGFRSAYTYASRETSRSELNDESGLNPAFLDNSRVVLFTTGLTIDAQILTPNGMLQDWYDDPSFDPGGGEADSRLTRLATTGDGGAKIRLYTLDAPPPAAPTPHCDIQGPAGSFFHPSWSPDGSGLAWQEDDGIHVAHIDLASCAGDGPLVIPGGVAPDWGAASVPSAAGGGGAGGGGGAPGGSAADTAAPAVTVRAPRRLARRTLLRGVKVTVTCSEACTATGQLMIDRATARRVGLGKKAMSVGRARKTLAGPGRVTLTIRPPAKARRKLRHGKLRRVSVKLGAVDLAGNRAPTLTRRVAVR